MAALIEAPNGSIKDVPEARISSRQRDTSSKGTSRAQSDGDATDRLEIIGWKGISRQLLFPLSEADFRVADDLSGTNKHPIRGQSAKQPTGMYSIDWERSSQVQCCHVTKLIEFQPLSLRRPYNPHTDRL
jgi:hypothetical protein